MNLPQPPRLRSTLRVAAMLVTLALVPFTHAHGAPLVIAHRGGTGDAPENTLRAFDEALANQADALWMTVQITRDGVPILYRPADLSALTDGHGPVGEIDFNELRRLNAGDAFSRKDASGQTIYPYRDRPLTIPTLREALRSIPSQVPIMLDMKQEPAAPLVDAVSKVLDETHAWSRVRLYSTDSAATELMRAKPGAQVFESRDTTRSRLVQIAMNGVCDAPPAPGSWVGIEFHRNVEVIERYTLGEGVSKVDAHWWTPAAMQCFKSRGNVHVVVFGIDTPADYAAAAALGADAVMTDSPQRLKAKLRESSPPDQ